MEALAAGVDNGEWRKIQNDERKETSVKHEKENLQLLLVEVNSVCNHFSRILISTGDYLA